MDNPLNNQETVRTIEDIFPTIKDAYAYSKHGKHAEALQVYVDILNEVSEGTEEHSLVLLKYAQCLLEYIMYQSEMNYKKILQTRNPIPEDEIEEDLENCWECLETCRLHFEDLHDRTKLAEVYKGLGDVQCMKNCFEEGRTEYLKAIDCCDDEVVTVEILECIADCFSNEKRYPEAIDYYNQIVSVYEKLGMQDEVAQFKGMIEGLKALESQQRESDSEDTTEGEPVDINHLKKQQY